MAMLRHTASDPCKLTFGESTLSLSSSLCRIYMVSNKANVYRHAGVVATLRESADLHHAVCRQYIMYSLDLESCMCKRVDLFEMGIGSKERFYVYSWHNMHAK